MMIMHKNMLNKFSITTLLVTLTVLLTGAMFFSANVAVVQSASKDDVCKGVEATGGTCDPPAPGELTVDSAIKTAINILSFIVGVGAVIMIIVVGFQYVLSGGDSAKTGTAKYTILYAIIGLVVVALAQIIVRFVLN